MISHPAIRNIIANPTQVREAITLFPMGSPYTFQALAMTAFCHWIGVVIKGLILVTPYSSFRQSVSGNPEILRPLTGCPVENFGQDMQQELNVHSN